MFWLKFINASNITFSDIVYIPEIDGKQENQKNSEGSYWCMNITDVMWRIGHLLHLATYFLFLCQSLFTVKYSLNCQIA